MFDLNRFQDEEVILDICSTILYICNLGISDLVEVMLAQGLLSRLKELLEFGGSYHVSASYSGRAAIGSSSVKNIGISNATTTGNKPYIPHKTTETTPSIGIRGAAIFMNKIL